MEIESNYTKLEKIGQGAYGAVFKAIDNTTNQIVALKVCRFDQMDQGIPSTCFREISILKSLNHPNIVKLLDVKVYKGVQSRIELAFEFVDFDLSRYIKHRMENASTCITESEAKDIIKNILQGINYLHQQGFLHRDLKPHNILVTKEGNVKIADFGLGRICSFPIETMSKEIETLWYRSPELLLGSRNYDEGVDSWSIGCIFFELIEGTALFQSESEIGQLFEIFKTIGTPHRKEWPQITEMEDFKPNFPKFHPRPIETKRLSVDGLNWMLKLLKANPKKRMTVKQALSEDYLYKK